MPPDFTFAAFEDFCRCAAGFPVLAVVDRLICSKPLAPPFVILRVDVDYRETHALALASIAHRCGVRGSFYFRHRRGGFDMHVMRAVARLGHEIGYHFETLDTCRGDFNRAGDLFLEHVDQLRSAGFDIHTTAAHGAPPTAATYRRNLDLVSGQPDLLHRAGLLGEATLSLDFGQVIYVSDAAWRWRHYAHFSPGTSGQPVSLRHVMRELGRTDRGVYINFHPQQWFEHPASMMFYRARHRLGRQVVPRWQRLKRLGR